MSALQGTTCASHIPAPVSAASVLVLVSGRRGCRGVQRIELGCHLDRC